MKNLFLLFIVFLLLQLTSLAQEIVTERTHEPVFFKVTSHNPNFENIPQKSFYKSKADWQYIIDTTWGPGLPLAQKQQIFNTYITKLEEEFDGFESLGFTPATWDTFKTFYYSKIDTTTDTTTSRGRFSAIMYYFGMNLFDGHTYAYDHEVIHTPLNPGIPVLVLGGFASIEHFGAVLTVLEDSTALVLRTVDNHPLNLEPGDIILGYEGVLWKDLVQELMAAELPAFGGRENVLYGGTTGSPSSYDSGIHISAGMNWHLFETIDILKHSTSDTVHLSVYPLLSLPTSPMLNNEQMPIPGVPFPDFFNGQYVSYGIIEGTNTGYIYLYQEEEGPSDQQFYEAVTALIETDALIIDLRINFGGWAFFRSACDLLFNEYHLTIEDSYRCNSSDFTLCPSGNSYYFWISGSTQSLYDRPIAMLLGPTCVSMGDITAQRFSYHPTIKFFGKSSAASYGDNIRIQSFPDWTLRYSLSDPFHVNEPGSYLNRKEFPIDFPVWFSKDDVANGYDTVVEEALNWMNNLVYGHNVTADKIYYSPGYDTVNIAATIENPNSHNVTAQIFFRNFDDTLIDSLELFQTGEGDIWNGKWLGANYEDIFKLEIKATDQTTGESFSIENVKRIATAGPVTLDSVSSTKGPFNFYYLQPFVRNEGNTFTITNAQVKLLCNDPWVSSIGHSVINLPDIAPGETVGAITTSAFQYIDSLFPGYFNINVELMVDRWTYWTDSMQVIVTGVEKENMQPLSYKLEQNYPNPFNPATTIVFSIAAKSKVSLKVFNTIGEQVALLVNEEKSAGSYEVGFNATNFPSGVYFYQLKAGNFAETKKMLLLK